MNILCVGNFGHGWDGSICDEEHIAKALEEQGHEVIRLQREEPWEVSPDGTDFTLIAQWGGYTEEFIAALPRPLIYWAFDYQMAGQDWHERLIASADLYLSKRIADSKYENWQWLAQDFAPMFLDKDRALEQEQEFGKEKDIDVLFTGTYLSWSGNRNNIMESVDNKFNLTIHSLNADEWKVCGRKNVQGPIMDEGLPGLYARAKINLAVDNYFENGYWSDRNAQIMACGGFTLTYYTPLMEATFHDGVAYYYNIPDCLKKIEYYLAHPEERDKIAKRGYEIAHSSLMVSHRVKDLTTIVENYIENSSI